MCTHACKDKMSEDGCDRRGQSENNEMFANASPLQAFVNQKRDEPERGRCLFDQNETLRVRKGTENFKQTLNTLCMCIFFKPCEA